VCATIKPAQTLTEEEKNIISKFCIQADSLQSFEAANAFTQTKDFFMMSLKASNAGEYSLYHDTLQIAIFDPKLPPVTLIDLPGLMPDTGNDEDTEDITITTEITNKYMRDTNSFNLFLVDASKELDDQPIRSIALDVNPDGERTIAIITRPDFLIPGSKRESEYLQFIQVGAAELGIKCYSTKNQDSENGITNLEDRENEEVEFFSKGRWSALDPERLGITALRTELGRVLEENARRALPKVIKTIQNKLLETRARLNKLGKPRANESLDECIYPKSALISKS
jgi:hypothetical protein